MLIILTGKTASGKDTIKSVILGKYKNLKRVITTTSRSLRVGERNGFDYHFLTRSEFEEKIRRGEFAEYVKYGGNLYGTEKEELTKALTVDTLWKIDPSRAGEIRDFLRRTYPKDIAEGLTKQVVVIYIAATDEVILERLKRRDLTGQEIQKRMQDDWEIWQQNKKNYDFVVENVSGQLDKTIDKVIQIIENKSKS